MHQLVQALARRDWEAASASVASSDWEAADWEAALAPLFESQPEVRADPLARRAHWTRIESRGDLAFDVVQTLVDEEGEGAFQLEATIELEDTRLPAGPMLAIQGIRG